MTALQKWSGILTHSISFGERPLAIDLFTGLHGWGEGLVAEGWRVVGFDLEDMCAQFNQPRPDHVQLVIQDVVTLRGGQFRGAHLIVCSPPCQAYSYRAMPWKRAKALPPPDLPRKGLASHLGMGYYIMHCLLKRGTPRTEERT